MSRYSTTTKPRPAILLIAGWQSCVHPAQLQLWAVIRAVRQVPGRDLPQGADLPVVRPTPRAEGVFLSLFASVNELCMIYFPEHAACATDDDLPSSALRRIPFSLCPHIGGAGDQSSARLGHDARAGSHRAGYARHARAPCQEQGASWTHSPQRSFSV